MTIPVGLGLFFIFYVSIGFWMVAWYSIRVYKRQSFYRPFVDSLRPRLLGLGRLWVVQWMALWWRQGGRARGLSQVFWMRVVPPVSLCLLLVPVAAIFMVYLFFN
ncbi:MULTISPECIES: hypothetical protein [Stenotrophomonas]|uniref:hypothetical protein n=1 Tax=Stenotrophomonas TaxID=40323 RepID=UPI002E790220|nr:hypothetical protein [[Pseudomonas] hibiscicola]